jgi:alkylhydroperoxidase family enzyme
MHSALLSQEHPELVGPLRTGAALADPRLQALADFVRALLERRGQVPEDTWQRFQSAGFSEQQALDAVLGSGVYLLSTLSNVLTEAPLDAAFQAFRWSPTDIALAADSQAGAAP